MGEVIGTIPPKASDIVEIFLMGPDSVRILLSSFTELSGI